MAQHALAILAAAPGPLGSGAIAHQLAELGLATSQPTIGRVLQELDEQGYTIRISNKGRILTDSGRRQAAAVSEDLDPGRTAAATLMAVGRSTLAQLRQAMLARRTIEREIARLAAEQATPEQIALLEHIVAVQRSELDCETHGAEAAISFHVALYDACGNRFLADAARLVRDKAEVLRQLMYQLGATIGDSVHSHAHVLEAIIARDPREAERAMVVHMNDLVRHVEACVAALGDGSEESVPQ